MYQVNLLNSAKKDLKRLDKRFQQKTILYLKLLKENPLLGVKMEGQYQSWFKIKIPPLRIVYSVDFKTKTIWVRAIGFRGGAYR